MHSQTQLLRGMLLRCLLLAAVFRFSTHGQTTDQTAKELYRESEQSVFLIYVNDSGGQPLAFGSGFLVAPRRIVTNEHVINGGTPVLAVGPVRLPLKVLRVDHVNDLALLEVDTPLTSAPLKIQNGQVAPGEAIFALGNPEGLEKTISQGIISGIRDRNARELLQITSPISHGSSGGPILNSRGEVVGVAVGMLVDGQNLNFAVPAKFITALLTESTRTTIRPADVASMFSELEATLARHKAEKYSSNDDSAYQQQLEQSKALLEEV